MQKFDKLSILIVGSGAYVIGCNENEFGTLLPAVLQFSHNDTISKITIASRSLSKSSTFETKLHKLCDLIGSTLLPECKQCDFTDDDDVNNFLNFQHYDVCIVCVPDHLHCKICLKLINRKIHCLVVKPMACTVKEALLMQKAAKDNDVVCQVEFHKRLDHSNLILRDAINSNDIGFPLYATVEYSQRKCIPLEIFSSWAANSNIFQYLGVHYVDLIYYITDFKPLSLHAWGQKCLLKKSSLDTWDAIQVVIEWETPYEHTFISSHITNWIDPNCSSAMSDQKINFVGTKGRFTADQKNRGVQLVTDNSGVEDINPYFSKSYNYKGDKTYKFEGYGISSVTQFLGDVISFKKNLRSLEWIESNRPSFSDGLISTAVIEAVSESLLSNEKVRICYD